MLREAETGTCQNISGQESKWQKEFLKKKLKDYAWKSTDLTRLL